MQQVVHLFSAVPTAPFAPSTSQNANLEDEPNLQGELGIWITLLRYSFKFPNPVVLQDRPNLDVEVNLKGVPPGQVEVLEAGLKAYRREHREMPTERETQLRRLVDETKSQFQRVEEDKDKAT